MMLIRHREFKMISDGNKITEVNITGEWILSGFQSNKMTKLSVNDFLRENKLRKNDTMNGKGLQKNL